MALRNYAAVGAFIDSVLTANGDQDSVGGSPHGAFWRTLGYNDFVNGPVPGVKDPNTNQPIPILVSGSATTSNIVLALQGAGPLFGPAGAFGQMPFGGTPFTDPQIGQIADWINGHCPNPP